MKAIHIRHIPDDVLEKLKWRAEQHHRSLQKEIEVLLKDAARMIPPLEKRRDNFLDGLHTVAASSASPKIVDTWSREEIYSDDGR